MKNLKLSLVKTVEYDLKPFGKFLIKWNCGKKSIANPNIIPFVELNFDYNNGMPYTKEQYNDIVKYMKKNKTDILTQNGRYYTILSENLVECTHSKLIDYKKKLELKLELV
jgi:formyltetrahydrofolate hydrolase